MTVGIIIVMRSIYGPGDRASALVPLLAIHYIVDLLRAGRGGGGWVCAPLTRVDQYNS